MLKRLYIRYQDLLGWLPLQVVLTAVAIIVIGAHVTGFGTDLLHYLARLPVDAGYALLALGFAYLGWRRWRKHLTDEQQEDWWARLMAWPHGAPLVYVVNAAFYLLLLWMLLRFMQPVR